MRHVVLTPRQLQVVRLLADGMTYAEIGEQLGISWRTVEIHARLARGKVGAKTNAALVSRARPRDLAARSAD